MYIIFSIFILCIQCKLTLQVQNKHIKILKKKKKGSNKVGELEGKKRRKATH